MIEGDLRLQPLVHVEDVAAAVRFYQALGAGVVDGAPEGDFALIEVGGAQVGLLGHPPNPEQDAGLVELNFSADDLDAIETQLRAAGVQIVQPVGQTDFGRQLIVRAPDGLLVKVNELAPGGYT